MLIRSPCVLGEWFEHHRRWGYTKPHCLTGADFFLWSCGMEPVTLHGNRSPSGNRNQCVNTDFFYPEDTNEIKIAFEIQDRYFSENGVPMKELGIDREKNGRINGIRMANEKEWYYRIGLAPHHGESIDVRTPELDALFEQLLPAVSVDLLNFL